MKVIEFYRFLDEKIPSELSCDFDNDGLICCPCPDREVTKVLIALDATADVADEAVAEGCEVILTHHPMIFSGQKSVAAGDFISDKLIKLIKNDISVFCFHTRLDAVDGGVNDILCRLLGLGNVVKAFGGLGRIGELPSPLDADGLATLARDTLGAQRVEYSDCGKMISRVAVVGGSGSDMVRDAVKAGADALISGEIKYHDLTDSADFGLTVIAAGHFFTENPVTARLFELSAEAGVIPVITYSNRIKYL